MNQLEFISMIKTMLQTREIQLNEGERRDSLAIIENIDMLLKERYRSYIINEIQNIDCVHPSECDYDSWYCFFGDTDGVEVEEYMRILFTEEECEKIWIDSHSK